MASGQIAHQELQAPAPTKPFRPQPLKKFRPLHPGMGQAVAERTILRRKANGVLENWGDVANRVALGNSLLCKTREETETEHKLLRKHISNATLLMSGRHLQHGDETQPERNQEVFCNCSTSATSFLMFYLLMNGSGVGRCYDDDLILVNWDHAPTVRCVISDQHPDYNMSAHESVRDARHKYNGGANILWHEVEDNREGWAKALELWENAAFEKIHKDKMLILDFSKVRPRGTPIMGMQGRPSSGPVPLMNAFHKANTLKGANLRPWQQALYIDHYFAECVLVGGARRSARWSGKFWKDESIIEFINAKRPIEYDGLSMDEIAALRKNSSPFSFLWSSNNSVLVDKEFWNLLELKRGQEGYKTPMARHARKVFKTVSQASYGDGTGEPAFVNVDKLVRNDAGWDDLNHGDYIGSAKYQVNDDTQLLLSRLAKRAKRKKYSMVVNPCVTADTWVQTDKGPRQVHELVDTPFNALVNGKAYPSKKGFWKTGNKPVFKVETNRGYSLRITDNHELLVETVRKQAASGEMVGTTVWKELKDIRVGDKLVLQNHRPQEHDLDYLEFEQGWLLGEMVGDGGYNPEKYAGYVRFWGDSKEEMGSVAEKIVSPMSKRGIRATSNVNNGTVQVMSKSLTTLADGLIAPKTKDILPALEKKSASFVRGFIRGFFDADGSVQGNTQKGRSIRLGQSNIPKLEAVQRMLLRLGIASTVYKNRQPERDTLLPDGKGGLKSYRTKAAHELVISRDNIPVFADLIGFNEPEKAEKLATLVEAPVRGHYKDAFTTRVTAIEPDGVEDVYDCTVEEVHCFDANGITAHNCSEIPLSVLGGFCVIADLVPFHAATLDEVEEAVRAAVRALIRVNTMDSVYHQEVKRTNRIGVGLTGVHEFAWKFFQLGFRDLLDEEKAKAFWYTLSRFSRAAQEEAISYSKKLGFVAPHTVLTIKPSGSVSKLFGLTEGWHLPPMAWYLRWVQFRNDDPLVEEYKQAGCPVRENLEQYQDTSIVGFPTAPAIASLGMGDKLVTADEATMAEQYSWVKLGEKYWIVGIDENGVSLEDRGGQISFTLKYDPEKIDYAHFASTMKKYQPQIKCCSVMPQIDATAYEYQPEQPLTKAEYEEFCRSLSPNLIGDIGLEHLGCEGTCPIDYKDKKD